MSGVNASSCYLFEWRNFSFEEFESYKNEKRDYFIDYLSFGFPWLKLFILLTGIATNVLNIIVLTRKNQSSSINIQFVALECVNLAWYTAMFPEFVMFFNKNLVYVFSQKMSLVRIISVGFDRTCVCASNWLTVSVGVWRFLAITFPFKSAIYCDKYRSKVVVSVIILFTLALYTFYYFSFECHLFVYELTDKSDRFEEVAVRVTDNRLFYKRSYIFRLYKAITILVSTTVPCLLLIVVVIALILRLWLARRARKAITNEGISSMSKKIEENNAKEFRLTLVLTAMIFMYFITYLPVSIVNLMRLFYLEISPHTLIYRLAWNRCLVLICNSLTICFYCLMSARLRETYARLLTLPFSRSSPTKTNGTFANSTNSFAVSQTSIL